jgi:CubicO group peptidase (beta-lactamase class C family)
MRQKWPLVTLFTLLSSCALRPEAKTYLSMDNLNAALEYSRSHGGQALLVSEAGALRLNDYQNGAAAGDIFSIKSITKGIWTTLAAAACQDGLLQLDERVSDTIQEWAAVPGKKDITVRQLFWQTSGLAPGFDVVYADSTKNKYQAAVSLPLIDQPGGVFRYGPGHWETFGEFLRRKLLSKGSEPLSYLEKRLFRPLSIAHGAWLKDAAGNALISSGAKLSAQNLLRFGEFLLHPDRGDKAPLIRPENLAELFKPSGANPAYGLGLWLNSGAQHRDCLEADPADLIAQSLHENGGPPHQDWDKFCISRQAPADTVALMGSFGQRIYVVPSRNLVIVRTGAGDSFKDREFLTFFFVK